MIGYQLRDVDDVQICDVIPKSVIISENDILVTDNEKHITSTIENLGEWKVLMETGIHYTQREIQDMWLSRPTGPFQTSYSDWNTFLDQHLKWFKDSWIEFQGSRVDDILLRKLNEDQSMYLARLLSLRPDPQEDENYLFRQTEELEKIWMQSSGQGNALGLRFKGNPKYRLVVKRVDDTGSLNKKATSTNYVRWNNFEQVISAIMGVDIKE